MDHEGDHETQSAVMGAPDPFWVHLLVNPVEEARPRAECWRSVASQVWQIAPKRSCCALVTIGPVVDHEVADVAPMGLEWGARLVTRQDIEGRRRNGVVVTGDQAASESFGCHWVGM
jgi:hypothetical protein